MYLERELTKEFYHDVAHQYLRIHGKEKRPLLVYNSTSIERFCIKLALVQALGCSTRIRVRTLEEFAEEWLKETEDIIIVWSPSLLTFPPGERKYSVNLKYFREESDAWSKPVGMVKELWGKELKNKREELQKRKDQEYSDFLRR